MRFKRCLAMLLCCLFLACALPHEVAYAATTYSYNPDKAIQYAKDNAGKTSGKCATFVSKCLRAGGLKDVNKSGAGDLILYLRKQGYGKVLRGSDATKVKNLSKGDVIGVICKKHSDYRGMHVVLCTSVDKADKEFRYYQHNPVRKNKPMTESQLEKYHKSFECSLCNSNKNLETVIVSMNVANKKSSITVSDMKYPSELYYSAYKFAFAGKITSTYELSTVRGGIYNASTGKKVQEYIFNPNTKTFDIAKSFGAKLNTSKLAVGKYTYKITCTDVKNYSKTVVDKPFVVEYKVGGGNPEFEAIITTSGLTSPSTLNYGDKFAFKGKITSNYKLSSVVGGIYNASTGKKVQEYTFNPNATTFDIAKNFGSKLNTAKLAAGKYKYRIYCTDAETQTCKTVVDKTFTVKKAPSSIKVSGLTVPDDKIIQGSKFYFKGNITSTYKLKTVVGGIYSSTGKKVQVYTYSPNKTSLNIYDTFDRKIRMGNLAPGKYVYKIVCTDVEGYTKTIVNEEFTVLKAGTITVKSATLPKNIKCGSKFYFKGTISSTYKIKKAYGGLYTTSGKKVQYFSYSPNSTKLDIYKTFDRDLRMAKLSKGNYVYKIVCEDIYGTSKTVINHKFVVK